ncbi:Hexokinase [Corchorus capsularis]|uniref:Phosphotransferase n=2 Tax=Corchorus TaxID=93758 RepID=A0A1R3GE63_COCAP|nr:Hexokinase [Corchorus capsularis]
MMKKEVALTAVTTTAAAVVVVVAFARQYWRQRKDRQWKKTNRILRKFASESATPVPKLWEVANAMVSDMEASVSSDHEQAKSSLNMLVSYISPLPSGNEKGMYYGVNLRGTDFLMVCARLAGKYEPISDLFREEISIPSNVLTGTSQELFNFIAVEVARFISAHPMDNDESAANENKLGFTLSYAASQATTAQSESAIKWNNFCSDDSWGKELVDQINQALGQHGVDMRVSALVDDTVGDLAGGRYYNKDSVAAISLGMGTNAAYVDSAPSAPKWQDSLPKAGEIVINMEWGNFDSSHLPITQYDASLDSDSSNASSRKFEKLISGMYLGEIVRRVLVKMAQETALFGESVPSKLLIPYLLRSPDMAAMHQDTSEDREIVNEKLKEIFGITNSTTMAREIVAEVCDIVTERGARLAGAGIVAIIKKLGRIANRKSVIIIEGGLYEHYRIFRNYLHSSVWEMLGNELSDNIIVEHSHGGSGAGALFLAASQNPTVS